MPVATFDTLKYATALKEAGMPDRQAEAQARVLGEAFQVNLKDLATKDDVTALGKELRGEMRELELRVGNKIDAAVAALSNKIDAAVAALTNAIDRAVSKTDNVRTEVKGEMARWYWIIGATWTVTAGVVIRLFLYPPR